VQSRARDALLIVAAIQIPASAVFVLDGVLIGASDTRTQQWGNVAAFLVFVPCAAAVVHWHLGIVAIWCGLFAWMLTRLAVNAGRFRGARWTTVAT
jgi:Na+-driven multidrug efflux pump